MLFSMQTIFFVIVHCRFTPRFFENKYDAGWAELTREGRHAVEEEIKEETAFCIEVVDPRA